METDHFPVIARIRIKMKQNYRGRREKQAKGFFSNCSGEEREEYVLYASHSIWKSKEDFINWTKSEAFKLAHKNAGQHKHLYIGAPSFEGFEKVL